MVVIGEGGGAFYERGTPVYTLSGEGVKVARQVLGFLRMPYSRTKAPAYAYSRTCQAPTYALQ